MDFFIHINEKHSKENCQRVVDWVDEDEQKFKMLVAFLSGQIDHINIQRAFWPVSYIVEKHPQFLTRHWPLFVGFLKRPNLSSGIKRHILRSFVHQPIPRRYQGEVMSLCFKMLENVDESTAVKAFSLDILLSLLEIYPDIKSEIQLLIEEQKGHASKGFNSKAKKILQCWT